jgi:hypothetical protein
MRVCACVQAAVRGYMSREHQMLTWHTLEGDLEAKQKALSETDKIKVRGRSTLWPVRCARLCCVRASRCVTLPACRAPRGSARLAQVRRVDELRNDISCLELSISAAKAEYDKIKAVNLSEAARFAAERRAEYSVMLENFTATQVRCAGASAVLAAHAPVAVARHECVRASQRERRQPPAPCPSVCHAVTPFGLLAGGCVRAPGGGVGAAGERVGRVSRRAGGGARQHWRQPDDSPTATPARVSTQQLGGWHRT